MIRKNYVKICIILSAMSSTIFSMNIPKYEHFFMPEYHEDKNIHLSVFLEKGREAQGFNEKGDHVNVLRIWSEDEKGCGTLDVDFGFACAARYSFESGILLTAYLPAYVMRLKNVRWEQQEQDENFAATIKKEGDCLDILDWKRRGLGDLVLLLEWMKDFYQVRPLLKNVHIGGRFGLNIPTGLKQDEDKILALPFGSDGSFGLIFAGGLQVTLGKYIRPGFDIELMHFFGNIRKRRIKTQNDTEELLFLNKIDAYKDWGLTQQFTLYLQVYKFLKGLSCKVGYQFLKHGEDVLSLCTNTFSNEISNKAESLREKIMHHFLFMVNYNFSEHMQNDARVIPHISFFAKVPFKGKRVALSSLVGITLSVDF